MEEETTGHPGHEVHALAGAGGARDGARPERVPADAAGEVEIEVPRERAGTFGPVVVEKRRRRLAVVDAVAISLYAEGSTTGEISARFAVVCGASICKDTVSRITDEGRGGDAGPPCAALAVSTGPGSRGTCGRSAPHPRSRRPGRGSRSSKRSGAGPARRSPELWRAAWEGFPPFLAYDA